MPMTDNERGLLLMLARRVQGEGQSAEALDMAVRLVEQDAAARAGVELSPAMKRLSDLPTVGIAKGLS